MKLAGRPITRLSPGNRRDSVEAAAIAVAKDKEAKFISRQSPGLR